MSETGLDSTQYRISQEHISCLEKKQSRWEKAKLWSNLRDQNAAIEAKFTIHNSKANTVQDAQKGFLISAFSSLVSQHCTDSD